MHNTEASPLKRKREDSDDDDGDHHHRKRRSRSSERRKRRSHRRRRYFFITEIIHDFSRSRSYSPDEHRHRSHHHQHHERSRSRDHRNSPNNAPPQLTIVEEKPGDRERRTVVISRLPSTVTEKDILDFFHPVGRIREVKLIRDRFSQKSKGYGTVEFFDETCIYPAIALNGRPLRGFPVMIKTSGTFKKISFSSNVYRC
jgi:RNA-binding protein 39